MIDKIALAKGLTTEQLADRTVPDLGLDATGRIEFDYGATQGAVLDEQLNPIVVEADGTRRKSPPRPTSEDDADLVKAAKKTSTP